MFYRILRAHFRNMSKVQYNITKFIRRITKIESLFYKKKRKMNNKAFKDYKSQMILMIVEDTA